MRSVFEHAVVSVVSLPGGEFPANATAVLDFSLSAPFNPKGLTLEGDVLSASVTEIWCGNRLQTIPPHENTDSSTIRCLDLGAMETCRAGERFSISVCNRTAEPIHITGFLRVECDAPDPDPDSFVFMHDRRRFPR